VYTPHAELYHYESSSRKAEVAQEEIDLFLQRWRAVTLRDPYTNGDYLQTCACAFFPEPPCDRRIVVTYRPDPGALEGLRALPGQVEHIVVADNGSGKRATSSSKPGRLGAVVLKLGRNLGVGARTTRASRGHDIRASHVCFSPGQRAGADCRFALEAEARCSRRRAVAALGRFYDHGSQSWPFYDVDRRHDAHRCDGQEVVPCDFLIHRVADPTLVLDEVGGMNEGYFLEHVDHGMGVAYQARGTRCRRLRRQPCASLGDDASIVPLSRARQVQSISRTGATTCSGTLFFFGGSRSRRCLGAERAARLLLAPRVFSLMVPRGSSGWDTCLLGLWHGLLRKTGPLPGPVDGIP